MVNIVNPQLLYEYDYNVNKSYCNKMIYINKKIFIKLLMYSLIL